MDPAFNGEPNRSGKKVSSEPKDSDYAGAGRYERCLKWGIDIQGA
jgi:hypothetical protein